jgi:tRNA(Ile)-lysidine synthase
MAASRKKTPDLVSLLQAHWPDPLSGQCTLEVGLSGGLDSVVLLHLLQQVCESRSSSSHSFSLSAVHVHHGLSAHADSWAAFCQALCAKLNIPLRIEHVSVSRAGGQSLEAQARESRYAAFAKTKADALVLAQHQDDLAETVLLQTLRGGGPHALAAMPVWREANGLVLWRPLLSVSRQVLHDYALEQNLTWVEDDSNTDSRFLRNWLRNECIPQLAQRLPNYRAGLVRSAGQMADAAQVLDEVAAEDLASIAAGGRLSLAKLMALSPARQRLLLLRWVGRQQIGLPTPGSLEAFQVQICKAAPDRQPEWRLPGGVVLRYREWLFAVKLSPIPRSCSFVFHPQQPLAVPEWGGVLHWSPAEKGLSEAWVGQTLWLKPRKGGEGLPQSFGTKAVKNLLQEAGVPPYWRERWPLIWDDATLLAVAGVAVGINAQNAEGRGWWPKWEPES